METSSFFGIFRALAVGAIVAIYFSGAARADIAAYNDAVKKADFKAAAAEAAKTWPTLDKQNPDATIVAREFAWTSMMAERSADAVVYARWLVEEGPHHTPPDAQPLTSAVLLRWAELGPAPNAKARKALSAALAARAASSEPADRISVMAGQQAYMLDWQAADWDTAEHDAALTAAFAAALGKEGRLLKYRAEVDQVVARFMDQRKPEAYAALGEIAKRMLDDYGPSAYAVGADTPEMHLGYRLYTWGVAMHAYLQSRANLNSQDREAKNDVKALLGKSLLPCTEQSCPTTRPDGVPPCVGHFDRMPTVTYPSAMLMKDQVGAMLFAIDTDDQGAVLDARVLSSVPSEGIGDLILPKVRGWHFIKNPTQPKEPCTLARKNGTLVMEFLLRR